MKQVGLPIALGCLSLLPEAAHAKSCEPQVIRIVAKQYGMNPRELSGLRSS